MVFGGPGADPVWRIGLALSALSLVVGVVVFALAFYGYRRNDSPAMLFLGCGVATLTVVSRGVTLVVTRYVDTVWLPTVESLAQLAGMGLILYAVVLARRE